LHPTPLLVLVTDRKASQFQIVTTRNEPKELKEPNEPNDSNEPNEPNDSSELNEIDDTTPAPVDPLELNPAD
jgi:hypothetical protein